MDQEFEADVAAIARIDAVPSILDVVCRTTGMGFAVVARVTDDRWIACGTRDEIDFGLQPGGELKVETTICRQVKAGLEPIAFDDAAEDGPYCGHPTAALYGFRSYISVPIVLSDGRFFGTLCAIDPKPARINTPGMLGMFKLFAGIIAFHFEANERLARSEATLLDERHTAELREQFIAVIGHDLRNPLAAIDAGARLLQRAARDEKDTHVIGLMRSSISRMSGLIDNVLDFARGRLGGGIVLARHANLPLQPVLEQVVAEFQAAQPHRVIDTAFTIDEPVCCDTARVAQLVSNLLGNALTYGEAGAPVRLRAGTDAGLFTLSVANAGEPIGPEALTRLFQPFSRGQPVSRGQPSKSGQPSARGAVKTSPQGLGLGLYIAAEVARAHGGALDVLSREGETCFTFRMPTAPPDP